MANCNVKAENNVERALISRFALSIKKLEIRQLGGDVRLGGAYLALRRYPK